MAMNTITPSAGRTRNALAMATPSKKVCSSSPTSAYNRALDTGEQVRLRVAGGILEHLGEQALQRLAHVGAGSHAGGEEVVARDGEVLQRQGVLGGADRSDDLGKTRHGMRDAGCGMRWKQRKQIVRVLAHLGEPLPDLWEVFRVCVFVAPLADGAAPFDVLA